MYSVNAERREESQSVAAIDIDSLMWVRPLRRKTIGIEPDTGDSIVG